jgi:REP element-mobilizing transposase RayT
VWRSRGYLPHIEAPNLVQHVIFRLADSLPVQVRRGIARISSIDRAQAIDAALDQGCGRQGCGRRELVDARIANLVETALLSFDGERYHLFAWCVMLNHVHVLMQTRPGYGLNRVLHSWKSYTAKYANRLLDREGPFWAPEYFDRFMRNESHLADTAVYIEANPVKAGLCENVPDWRFSSAWLGWGGRDARDPDPHCANSRQDAGAPMAQD